MAVDPFQVSLNELKQVVKNNGVLIERLDTLITHYIARLNSKISALEREKKECEKLKKRHADVQKQLDKANADLADVQGRLDKANTDLAEMKGRLDKANADHADVQKQLDKANADLAEMKVQLDKANADYVGTEYKNMINKYDRAQGEVERNRGFEQLKKTFKEKAAEVDTLSKLKESNEQKIDELNKTIKKLTIDKDLIHSESQKSNTSLQAKIKELSFNNGQLSSGNSALLEKMESLYNQIKKSENIQKTHKDEIDKYKKIIAEIRISADQNEAALNERIRRLNDMPFFDEN